MLNYSNPSMKNCGITCFSAEYAMNWCRNVPDKKRPLYLNSVRRLVDVYEHGRVMASHIFIYRYPSVYYQNHINSYISNISAAKVYTQRHLKNIRNCVSQLGFKLNLNIYVRKTKENLCRHIQIRYHCSLNAKRQARRDLLIKKSDA